MFPSSNMSVALLDLSIENQKGGYIKPNQIKLLKYRFPQVAPLLSPSSTLFPLGSLLSVSTTTFLHVFFHNDKSHRLSAWMEAIWMEAKWMGGGKLQQMRVKMP